MKKGGVEGESGYFPARCTAPVPCVADFDALNALLLSGCASGRGANCWTAARNPVGAALVAGSSRHLLCTRVTEGFDLAEVVFPLVDKRGCIPVKTSFYSGARSGLVSGWKRVCIRCTSKSGTLAA